MGPFSYVLGQNARSLCQCPDWQWSCWDSMSSSMIQPALLGSGEWSTVSGAGSAKVGGRTDLASDVVCFIRHRALASGEVGDVNQKLLNLSGRCRSHGVAYLTGTCSNSVFHSDLLHQGPDHGMSIRAHEPRGINV